MQWIKKIITNIGKKVLNDEIIQVSTVGLQMVVNTNSINQNIKMNIKGDDQFIVGYDEGEWKFIKNNIAIGAGELAMAIQETLERFGQDESDIESIGIFKLTPIKFSAQIKKEIKIEYDWEVTIET